LPECCWNPKPPSHQKQSGVDRAHVWRHANMDEILKVCKNITDTDRRCRPGVWRHRTKAKASHDGEKPVATPSNFLNRLPVVKVV